MLQYSSYPVFLRSQSEDSANGSFGLESISRCSSSDSNRSGEFGFLPSNFQSQYDGAYESFPNNDHLRMSGNADMYSSFGFGNFKIRNPSVSSPTSEQVSRRLAAFVHVGPSSEWNLLQWQPASFSPSPAPDNSRPHENREAKSNGFYIPHEDKTDNYLPRGQGRRQGEEVRRLEPSSSSRLGHPRPRPRLSPCVASRYDLLKNGRDVAMDSLDKMQVQLREGGRQWRENLNEIGQPTKFGQEPLKHRLIQVRATIRDELAAQASLDESRGLFVAKRRKRRIDAKKCKFCLSKKEDDDIVTHHNLFDATGLVSCPILQQYECELCHATGLHAHTLKYCPLNNPDTPHDVILRARFKVFLRNRWEQ